MDEIESYDMNNNFDKIKLNLRKGNYRYIGSGSGRLVYDLGNGYVIKVAKNRRGIAQNEVEHKIASEDRSELFAKIIKVSEDNSILVMEKAERIRRFSDILRYFAVKNSRELFQLDEINYIFPKYNLLQGDLYRLSNWGMVKDRPVIVDYGFTREVKRKYYLP